MKRAALRTRSALVPAHLATDTPSDPLAESFEENISEDLVDYDDEREVTDVVVQGTLRFVN